MCWNRLYIAPLACQGAYLRSYVQSDGLALVEVVGSSQAL